MEHLYLATNGKCYKIGMTYLQHPSKRMANILHKGTPKRDKFRLIDSFETSFDARALETLFCDMNHDSRIVGEYFFLHDSIVTSFNIFAHYFSVGENTWIDDIKHYDIDWYMELYYQSGYIKTFIETCVDNSWCECFAESNLLKGKIQRLEAMKRTHLCWHPRVSLIWWMCLQK